jgi:hypothetical protein
MSNVIMKSCPFFEKTELDYVYEVPSCIILICNTFFLIWIIMVSHIWKYIKANLPIQIVVAKLRQQTVLDHHRRHLKAAKVEIMKISNFGHVLFQALIFCLPLLGLGYLVTLVPPSRENNEALFTAFQIGRSLLLSTQVIMGWMLGDYLMFCRGWSSASLTAFAMMRYRLF